MLKSIQAYFPTENEAESVKTSLQSYETDTVEVSRLGDTHEKEALEASRDTEVRIFGVSNNNTSGAAGSGIGNRGNIVLAGENDPNNHNSDKYVLSVKVKEEDYDAILEIIHENQGKLE